MEDIDEEFLVFDPTSRIVSWMTQENQYAGIYDILIRASVADLVN
jgi:hypothetical protein